MEVEENSENSNNSKFCVAKLVYIFKLKFINIDFLKILWEKRVKKLLKKIIIFFKRNK